MARRREKPKLDFDVTGFLSILSIVTGLICLILFVIALRIAMNPNALKIVSLGLWSSSKGNIEDTRVPSYIDCYPDHVILYPGKTRVDWEDLQRSGNPVESLLSKVEANTKGEYVIVMVRPGSVKFYRTVRNMISKRAVEVGYDAIDADFRVDWDEAVKALNVVTD